MNEIWRAIAREAELSAEQLGIGVTALGKANYAQKGYYYQAFFALSIGIERTAKLIILLEHAIQNNGKFLDNKALLDYGHKLKILLEKVNIIASRQSIKDNQVLLKIPATIIHQKIVDILEDFSSNITRYYNLDMMTNAPKFDQKKEPISRWYKEIIKIVFDKHVSPSKVSKIEAEAILAGQMGNFFMVMQHTEDGKNLSSIQEACLHHQINEAAKPYVRMYVLQIIRFFTSVLRDLSYQAQGINNIPMLHEFFVIFQNSDSMFKSRKTWSIYSI